MSPENARAYIIVKTYGEEKSEYGMGGHHRQPT